jgi:retron-type reverse transcriptase
METSKRAPQRKLDTAKTDLEPIPNAHCVPVQFPLTVPTIYDRVCQQALLNRLEPIFEPMALFACSI